MINGKHVKETISSHHKLCFVATLALFVLVGLSRLPDCVAYFKKREIKSAYLDAAKDGVVPKPIEAPDAVVVAAMCGNGGVPGLVLVKTSDAVTELFSARYDERSSDWRFIFRHASTNYSKVPLGD